MQPVGSARQGLYYCGTCGKRSHSSQSVYNHIQDTHGVGVVREEPPRAMLAKIFALVGRVRNTETRTEREGALLELFNAYDKACKRARNIPVNLEEQHNGN